VVKEQMDEEICNKARNALIKYVNTGAIPPVESLYQFHKFCIKETKQKRRSYEQAGKTVPRSVTKEQEEACKK
jgi:hypothetical protein